MTEELTKQSNETLSDYKLRLAINKLKYGLTWQKIADMLNNETNDCYSETKYRKELTAMLNSKLNSLESNFGESTKISDSTNNDFKEFDGEGDGDSSTLNELIFQLKSLKVQNSDERRAANRMIARMSREDNLMELAKYTARIMDNKFGLKVPEIIYPVSEEEKEAILQISDWHCGIEINNYWNKFNLDICRDRVSKYIEKSIKKCLENNVRKVNVMNLGDLICGRIHAQLQIESQVDVIQQLEYVMEVLAEMLVELSKYFEVEFFNCTDNHSRIEPDKKKSLDLESFSLMIPWHLSRRKGIEDNDRITINEVNEFDQSIITTNILGWNICGVHGDKDKQKNAISNLTLLTRRTYDLVLTSHMHHFSGDERNECILISNPSLMGTDSFAKNLRLSSKPAQNLIIVSKDNPVDDLCRIIL